MGAIRHRREAQWSLVASRAAETWTPLRFALRHPAPHRADALFLTAFPLQPLGPGSARLSEHLARQAFRLGRHGLAGGKARAGPPRHPPPGPGPRGARP